MSYAQARGQSPSARQRARADLEGSRTPVLLSLTGALRLVAPGGSPGKAEGGRRMGQGRNRFRARLRRLALAAAASAAALAAIPACAASASEAASLPSPALGAAWYPEQWPESN